MLQPQLSYLSKILSKTCDQLVQKASLYLTMMKFVTILFYMFLIDHGVIGLCDQTWLAHGKIGGLKIENNALFDHFFKAYFTMLI